MAFADKIRIVEDDESRRIQAEFAARFKSLSGFNYPPKDQAEWTIVLTRAGFSQSRIEQFLNEVGFTGFEDCGELPRGYVSAPHGEWPIFSALLIEGLERWQATSRSSISIPAIAGCESATPEQLASESLTARHWAILGLIASRDPEVLTQEEIAAELDVEDRKTIRPELKTLYERGLTGPPEGKKRGNLITLLGRKVLQLRGT